MARDSDDYLDAAGRPALDAAGRPALDAAGRPALDATGVPPGASAAALAAGSDLEWVTGLVAPLGDLDTPLSIRGAETMQRAALDTAPTGALPRDLPPDEERREARRRLLDTFKPVEFLDRRTDDLLDKLWEFWNYDADPEQLTSDGWSEHGIDVWQRPYRHDIDQAFAAMPERLAAIKQRNEPPTGAKVVRTPMSDQDSALWAAEQRRIVQNPDLWEARHKESKLGEQLLDRDRDARLEAAVSDLERATLHEEMNRERARADASKQSPRSRGRPRRRASGYSDEERRRIAREIREQRGRNGVTWPTAAQLHDISEDTAQRWVAWLDEEEGKAPPSA